MQYTLQTIGSAIIISSITSTLGVLVLASIQRSMSATGTLFLFLFSMAFVGTTVGFLAGISQEPVAGDILPAALVFIGIGVGYIFSLDVSKGSMSAVATLCFSICFLFSYHDGSVQLVDFQESRRQEDQRETEVKSITESCAKYILSDKFFSSSKDDQSTAKLFCRDYLTFLR